jgi:DNA polymerase III delta subunit
MLGKRLLKADACLRRRPERGDAEFLPFRGEAALLWAQNLFSSQGKSIGRAALQQLLLASGDNLSILEQEAAKLCLYVGRRKEITLADVQLMASDNSVTSVFTLLDHIVAGHTVRRWLALEQF